MEMPHTGGKLPGSKMVAGHLWWQPPVEQTLGFNYGMNEIKNGMEMKWKCHIPVASSRE